MAPERQALYQLLRWMRANKQAATFSAVRGSTGQGGEYGVWRWQRGHAELAWTELPRGILVEFGPPGTPDAYGFVWNKILREFNDAVLPQRMGRGYFQYVLGIPVPKSEWAICRQNYRVQWQLFWRACRKALGAGYAQQ